MFKAWNKYQKKNNSLLGKKYIKDNGIFDINTAMIFHHKVIIIFFIIQNDF